MKKCYKCKEIKNIDDFYKCKSRYDKVQGKCKNCCKKSLKKYQENNRERVNALTKKWVNNNREKKNTITKNYYKNNPDVANASSARRHARKLQASPKWLTKEQIKEMNYFYKLAKELEWLCDEKLEVNHIIPLKGKQVCGLHVPWNLQILSKSENRKKNNKLKS